MKYSTGLNDDGHPYAAIESDGNPAQVLDKKVCASADEAESLCSVARNAGVPFFTADMLARVTEPPLPARDPLDHDGDGKKGGSKPRPRKEGA